MAGECKHNNGREEKKGVPKKEMEVQLFEDSEQDGIALYDETYHLHQGLLIITTGSEHQIWGGRHEAYSEIFFWKIACGDHKLDYFGTIFLP